MAVRRRGGTFDFVESDDVSPLEPERAKRIAEAYRRARERSISGRIKKLFKGKKEIPQKEVKETHNEDFKVKQSDGKIQNNKLYLYSTILIILLSLFFWQLLMLFTPDREEVIFKQADEKCSVYVESFCQTKKVEVDSQSYECLWNRSEQKCRVWWKK